MKLEVGQFVRTNEGYIAKIIKEIKDGRRKEFVLDRIVILNKRCTEIIRRTDKVISSHNIIDLIEVGDYVNGYKISGVYDDDGVINEYNLKHKKCLGKNIYDEDYQEYLIYEEEIETIVTKERFEAMAYKVV